MANHTDSSDSGRILLTVPAAHVQAFRFGVLRELEFDGGWVKSQAKEARDAIEKTLNPSWYPPHQRHEGPFDPFDCLGGPVREVQHDAEVLRQLGFKAPEGDVEVTGDRAALKFNLEATAKYCAAQFDGLELGGPEQTALAASVAWATGEAERLEVEREAEVAEEVAA